MVGVAERCRTRFVNEVVVFLLSNRMVSPLRQVVLYSAAWDT